MKLSQVERSALGLQEPSLNAAAVTERDKSLYGEWTPPKRRKRRGRSGRAVCKKYVNGEWVTVQAKPKPKARKATVTCKPAPQRVTVRHYAYTLKSDGDDHWSSKGELTHCGTMPPADLAAWVWSEVGGACLPTVTVASVELIRTT